MSCTIRLARFHLPDDTTDFIVNVILPDSEGHDPLPDSTSQISFSYGDGTVTTTSDVWQWELRGPAVTRSRFAVYMSAKDSGGSGYQARGTSGFQISSYPIEPDLEISASVSLTSAWGDTIMFKGSEPFDSGGIIRYKTYWGRTYGPRPSAGSFTDEQLTQFQ